MYAAGRDHPLREPCLEVLGLAETDRLEAVTSAEVVQEILHRFSRTDRWAEGVVLAEAVLDAFSPVLAITHDVVSLMPELARRYPSHSARDLIHVATCVRHAIGVVVSPDTDFDRIAEVERVPPEDRAALGRLLRR